MLTKKNNFIYFNINRCCQCGACLSICNSGALSVNIDNKGLHHIILDEEKCTQCLKCIRVCPAHILPNMPVPTLGEALGVWLVHARDENTRNAASSGGAGRLLFKTAIEGGVVDTGYALKSKEGYPWAEGRFWKELIDVSLMPNSIYHPVLALRNFDEKPECTSLVVIGCPCQLAAVQLLVGKKTRLIKIAIYCKQQKHLGFAEYVAKSIGQKFCMHENITPVRWRGDGWPGTVSMGGVKLIHEEIAAVPFGRHLWRVPGCKNCANPYGNDVDITLSDPWGIESRGLGKTLVVVWTKVGAELLEQASDELSVKGIPVETAVKAFNKSDEKLKAVLAKSRACDTRSPIGVRLAGWVEDCQVRALEYLLGRVVLPKIVLKVIAHLPDFRRIAMWLS